MTLTEFMRARLDDVQHRAEGSGRIAWLTYRDDDGGMRYTTVAAATVDAPDHWCVDGREALGWTEVQVIYDERWVLAEVDAKRRIVDAYEQRDAEGERHPVFGHHATGLLLAIKALATAYADHPDYDESWRP